VASWLSRSIFISNSSFFQNQIDGIALYDSEDIVVSNFLAYDNIGGAGISLDNKLKRVSFNGGVVKNNATHGVFARDSEDINFHDLMIYENSDNGFYLHYKSPASG
jgi:parallel beta-helix repeat protein